ncbi:MULTISPECIES: P-loop NTPase fold protein [unclassified Streptomyces]|uniref:KAP family P-loop NTPase fold protein n=1 Tax=unclassified Streptomyces TaxID=2593676 RepID=UPI002473AD35|nr:MULTISPECIES: P-loop NTPase fold protein [unclassified Streptomyces]MDH6550423.1 hypothetical protein [Streptomyces sp. SAI-041]
MGVQWTRLASDYRQFHALVTMLLLRLSQRARPIDEPLGVGRGAGDVLDITEAGEEIYYEIKAFAGEMTQSRRRQISETLRVVEKYEPRQMNIVCAIDLTPRDMEWFERLRLQYPFVGEWLGVTWLERQLAKFPDLLPFAEINPATDLLSRYERERIDREAALGGITGAMWLGKGAVHFRGFADRPADLDLLDRMPLVYAIADLLVPAIDGQQAPRVSGSDNEKSGPSVVAIEGPWGAGKSTLMHLIEKEVISRQEAMPSNDAEHIWAKIRKLFSVARISRRRGLSIRAAMWMLTDIKRRTQGNANAHSIPKGSKRSATPPKVLTVRFNPWSHQTSEQIWAGLTKEIVEASRSVQGVDRNSRERYWLAKNAERLDRHQLRRVAAKRLVSPLLRVGVFALAVPIVAQLAKAKTGYTVLGHQVNAPLIAILIPIVIILLGILHTSARYLLGRARSFLPGEILDGPVLSGAFALDASPGKENGLRDPYYNARSGYLYLVQHDIRDLLHTISASGREIIVFIDDLDRCSARTTAEVFEAINLFLSGALQVPQNGVFSSVTSCRFVLGLDTSVVAKHLDHAYAGFDSGRGATGHQDPSWGWTFLRKLIQLSVTVPPIGHRNLVVAMDSLLGPVDTPATLGHLIHGNDSPEIATSEEVAGHVGDAEEPEPQLAVQEQVLALETHQAVRDRLHDRLSSQRSISMREAKRFLTLWQFYLRVLAYKERDKRGISVEDAVHLVTLAEVSARWPALQSNLYSRKEGQTGLAVLAPHVEDDVEWARALRRVGLEGGNSSAACEGLRALLVTQEAVKIADLTQRIF